MIVKSSLFILGQLNLKKLKIQALTPEKGQGEQGESVEFLLFNNISFSSIMEVKLIILFSIRGMKNYNTKFYTPKISTNLMLMTSKSDNILQRKTDLPKSSLIKKEIAGSKDAIREELKMYQWRQRTEFPVVRVKTLNLLSEGNNGSVLEISVEDISARLVQLQDLPLFKIMYLLKEAIIGFERLFHKFGSFLITPDMIAINNQHKCKVWLNSQFSSNRPAKVNMDQAYFIASLYRMFEHRGNKLKNTIKFFTELNKYPTFCLALSFIEAYAKNNKLNIPESCRILATEKKSEKQGQSPNKKSNVIIRKTPPFIRKANLRLSLETMIGKRPNFFPIGQSFKSKKTGDTDLDNEPNKLSKSNFEERNFTSSSVSESKPENKDIFRQDIPSKLSPFNSFNFGNQWQEKPHSRAPQKSKKYQQPTAFKAEDFKSFGQINDEQNEEATRLKEQEVYCKNNWQKNINFLLNDTAINSSVHLGQDVKKGEKNLRKLDRLEKIRKDMAVSYANTPQKTSYLDDQHHPGTGVD